MFYITQLKIGYLTLIFDITKLYFIIIDPFLQTSKQVKIFHLEYIENNFSVIEGLRGVHRSGTGSDRTGPACTEDRNGGRLWTEDQTNQEPAFCLAADRVVARSTRATRHDRAT